MIPELWYAIISLNSIKNSVLLAGFGFSDKPQPKYGFDYTLKGMSFEV